MYLRDIDDGNKISKFTHLPLTSFIGATVNLMELSWPELYTWMYVSKKTTDLTDPEICLAWLYCGALELTASFLNGS